MQWRKDNPRYNTKTTTENIKPLEKEEKITDGKKLLLKTNIRRVSSRK